MFSNPSSARPWDPILHLMPLPVDPSEGKGALQTTRSPLCLELRFATGLGSHTHLTRNCVCDSSCLRVWWGKPFHTQPAVSCHGVTCAALLGFPSPVLVLNGFSNYTAKTGQVLHGMLVFSAFSFERKIVNPICYGLHVEPPKDVEFLILTSTTHECDLIWK